MQFLKGQPQYIRLIKNLSEKMCNELYEHNVINLRYLPKEYHTHDRQFAAISKNPSTILFLANITEDLAYLALSLDCSLQRINRPTYGMQLYAINKNYLNISYCENNYKLYYAALQINFRSMFYVSRYRQIINNYFYRNAYNINPYSIVYMYKSNILQILDLIKDNNLLYCLKINNNELTISYDE